MLVHLAEASRDARDAHSSGPKPTDTSTSTPCALGLTDRGSPRRSNWLRVRAVLSRSRRGRSPKAGDAGPVELLHLLRGGVHRAGGDLGELLVGGRLLVEGL